MKIAVCDDDVFALNIISDTTAKTMKEQKVNAEICTFSSAEELETAMESEQFDLVLLDIDMPGKDGIEAGKYLREYKEETDIIYVSNREDRVFDSLKVNPFGFIRKKQFLEDVPEILSRYLKSRSEKQEPRLVVKSKDHVVSLRLRDICYIEGQRKTQKICLVNQDEAEEIRYSMQDLEEELEGNGFLRVHKGYLVNYRHIRLFQKQDIIMDNGNQIPVSRRKLQEIKDKYIELMQEEGSLVIT